MGIVFAIRGNSLTARYSTGSPNGFGTTSAVTSGADAGALSGSLIDLTAATGKCLVYSGSKNCGENRGFSILMRIKANYTGAPSALRVFFQIGLGRNGLGPYLEFWHANTTGAVTAFGNNEANTRTFNSASLGNWTGITSGTYYDLFFQWDGTTTANAAKFYIDGTLLGSITAGAALSSSWKSEYFNPITIGTGNDVTISNFKLDEFVIWDDATINPTSVALVSGTGSLSGASRTSLVNVAALDASVWTPLAANKILTGNSQNQAGVVVNGTAVSGGLFRNPGLDGL